MFRECSEEDLGASDYSSDRAASPSDLSRQEPSSRSGIPSREGMEFQFLDWLRSKPPHEKYSYTKPRGCAFAQFLREAGYGENPDCDDRHWSPWGGGPNYPLPPHVDNAVEPFPNSFGAAADRLASALARQQANNG